MTEREFCYWLQGLFEVGKPETLNADQTEMIRQHLGLVFDRVINVATLDLSRIVHVDASKVPPATLPLPNTAGAVPTDWLRRQGLCGAAQAGVGIGTTISC
jgi:hypothetical protein